jgi:hypothetical protein
MFDSVKNIFKKKKQEPEKEKDNDLVTDDKKTEKALDELIQSSNSEQNTTSKSISSSSFYLENIEVERRILSEILKDDLNSVDPNKLYEKFASKISKWK